jgi:hypothetical protein
MATTTPIYNWPVPTSTDYVADGAVAIEALGDAVDSTLSTALGGAYPGLRLVKKQTIGTGVFSVTVNDAFSATYEAYKIVITGGSSTSDNVQILMGLGTSNANYYWVLGFNPYAAGSYTTLKGNNTSSWSYTGIAHTTGIAMNVDLINPFLAKNTLFSTAYADKGNTGNTTGYLNDTTSYTSLVIATGSAITGGTIYVYGYGAS